MGAKSLRPSPFFHTMRAKILFSLLVVAYCCMSTLSAQNPQDTLHSRKSVETSQSTDTAVHSHTIVRRVVRSSEWGGLPRARYKTAGYRIQVYTGANNRTSKQEALQMKQKVQSHFPELSVYVNFLSPRWVCRVGDFTSREEAAGYMQKLRSKRISAEARIVSCTVLRAE